ncbi:MAG: hypothetical protein LBM08_11590 [Dysgonamonadaceae bacterium]|jgi:hypothetical protein|nr:hypothetical protein [Dysgonamonadaceae bacterium]
MDVQKLFFEILKSKLPSNYRMADVVGDVLNVGSDSAYRRIRGEKELTLKELIALSQRFNISMDSITNYESNNILFKYTPLDLNDMDNYYAYMDDLSNLFEAIAKSMEKEIYFMAMDIPVAHFTPFLELTLFKIYTWFRSVNKLHITYDEFVSQLDILRLSAIYEKIGNAYNQIPSTEIWTKNTIEPTLRLLDYYSDLNCFEKKETLPHLCCQVLQLVDNIEKYTLREEKEYKGKSAFFRMYLSPVDIMNDFMITKRDGTNVTSIKLYTINGIFTSNEYFCSEVEKWMKDAMTKSLFLSGASARECFKFFQEIKNKVNNLLAKFEKLSDKTANVWYE